jgi:hypothetical protein
MMTLNISTAERDGKYVAYDGGATFSGQDLKRIGPMKCYVVTFQGDTDDEPIRFYAVDDETAKEYAKAKWHGPYLLTEKITTWRALADH